MTTSPAFQLDTTGPDTLRLSGVLSFDTASAALQAIESALANGGVARLDLAAISHSDSAGLACVLAALAEADRRGHAVQIAHVPPAMQALAQVCEVDRLMA